MNFLTILHVLGMVSVFTGGMMLLPYTVSLFYNEGDSSAFALASLLAMVVGGWPWGFFHKNFQLNLKNGVLILVLGWILVCAWSALPFVVHGAIPSFTDAFFEMMSGYTTTGATVLSATDPLPHGLRFWRHLTQLLGGLSFVLVALFVLPRMSMGGLLFRRSEADASRVFAGEPFNPRMKKVILQLGGLYLALVLLNLLLLWRGGMPLFEATLRAFGTLSTAGYFAKNASLEHYNSGYFETITMIFMFLGGISFLIYYRVLQGSWQAMKASTELRWYLGMTFFFCALVSWILWKEQTYGSFSEALHHGTFQVISFLTTSGLTTGDYEQWPDSAKMFLFILLFVGGCAGSTTSGVKIIHYVLILKYLYASIKKIMQPLEVLPIRINGQSVDSKVVNLAISYFILNIIWILLGGGVMVLLDDLEYFRAIHTMIATLMNTGIIFGETGTAHFQALSAGGKWFLSLTMLTGRLEMFLILILLHPSFWKK